MKELSTEEKAKRYDEAFARAREIHREGKAQCHNIMSKVFPELQESEDERIRKNCIHFLELQKSHHASTVEIDECIDWLEKQGEQKLVNDTDEDIVEVIKNTSILDMVEPKFKEGDWVSNGRYVKLIVGVQNRYYQFKDGTTEYIDKIDAKYHLWTIQDAKDGDVLAVDWYEGDDSWKKIIIFKKYHNKGIEGLINAPCVEGYGNTFKNRKIAFDVEVPYFSKTWTDNLHPATKEQRDLLFQKMKEAGYEWDSDRKELKSYKI